MSTAKTTPTLSAIGVTLLGGSCVFAICFLAFEIALRKQNTNIAPRCSARPRETIYNARAQQSPDKDHPQHRYGGNWIKWVMGLSDATLLQGIPGTGTREGGLSGSLLHVTLDSIVLLRFHRLGRKVTFLATFLCLGLLLPLYTTTPEASQLDDSHNCNSTLLLPLASKLNNISGISTSNPCQQNRSFVKTKISYRQTTLGNVPNLYFFRENQPQFQAPEDSIMFRLRASVLVLWLVTLYSLYLLAEEWTQMVSLRRTWYLEQRRGKAVLHGDVTPSNRHQLESEWHRALSEKDTDTLSITIDQTEENLYNRHVWIPHPEQPDTVPNVEPYSILIGPLPEQNSRKSFSNPEIEFPHQSQLQQIMEILEKSLPQEPGYSSPIAILTIVPCAKDIGPVWRQWYKTLTSLRRLLLIQRRIDFFGGEVPDLKDTHHHQEIAFKNNTTSRKKSNIYINQVFGILLDEEWIHHVHQTMGPEQLGVFSREVSQAASNFCPYGCMEGNVRNADLPTLQNMYKGQVRVVEDEKAKLRRRQQDFMFSPAHIFEEGEDEDEDNAKEDDRLLLQTSSASSSLEYSNNKEWNSTHTIIKRTVPSRLSKRVAGTDEDEDEGEMIELTSSLITKNNVRLNNLLWPTDVGLKRAESSPSLSRRTQFSMPSRMLLRQYYQSVAFVISEIFRKYNHLDSWKDLVNHLIKAWAKEDQYAVLTFTSRQAAAAARQALPSIMIKLQANPIPPLADAASFKLLPCRYFCRPVTVTINNLQKMCRLYTILVFLGLMYIFYTLPLTKAANRLDPDTMEKLFPKHEQISKTTGVSIPVLLSGLTTSVIWTLFFMLCPQVFKLLAYFGSNAASMAEAELRAMQFFWWFMVITAFAGPMLAYWIMGALYYNDDTLRGGLRKMLLAIAGTTPTTIAATWINWIIYRSTIIIPINFLLQFNTFMFKFLGLNCCSRISIGGGPGGPTPYRIFVDSGVVLMCCVALGPASPLVAPAALTYFCVSEPVLRRNCIFVYRPRYDDGGLRWCFCFDMVVSALIVGQLLLCLQMILKTAYGSSFIAALAIPTTVYFQWSVKNKYKPSFENTTLLRTTLLDGNYSLDSMTMERREEHRRFLVDAHKAAYIPACIAGTKSAAVLTDTPAVVIPNSIIDSRESLDDMDTEEELNIKFVVQSGRSLKQQLRIKTSTASSFEHDHKFK